MTALVEELKTKVAFILILHEFYGQPPQGFSEQRYFFVNMPSLRLEALFKAVVRRLWKGIRARESCLLGLFIKQCLKLTKQIEILVLVFSIGKTYKKLITGRE